MRPLEWALIQSDWSPYQKRRLGRRERNQVCKYPEKSSCEDMVGDSDLQAKDRGLRNTKSTNLILDFLPWNCDKINFCIFVTHK